jgi:hypothetical protein
VVTKSTEKVQMKAEVLRGERSFTGCSGKPGMGLNARGGE